MDAYSNQVSSSSGQLLSGLMVIAIIFVVGLTGEFLVNSTRSGSQRFMTLLDYTASSDDMVLTIRQDANKYPDAKPIGMSVDERTGIEFAYSFYILVNPATFTGEDKYKHVFHKGYTTPWPLMGPGVFMSTKTNTMRIFMNTYKNPYTYMDVHNIPVDKWVHVVLNCYKSGLDIFVNGNLASRIPFHGTIPYQNFEDITIFSTGRYTTFRGSQIPALGGNDVNFDIDGSFKGFLSNLIYTRYALSVNEISALMTAGPSKKLKQKTMDIPPYMADDWWANQ